MIITPSLALDATDSATRNNRFDTDGDYWREPGSRRFQRERSPEYSRERRAEPENPEESVWMILARQASLDPKSSSSIFERSPAAVTQNPEVLKPGNYLLVSWDALFWVEEETQETHICQISASVPQGDDFRCVLNPRCSRHLTVGSKSLCHSSLHCFLCRFSTNGAYS